MFTFNLVAGMFLTLLIVMHLTPIALAVFLSLHYNDMSWLGLLIALIVPMLIDIAVLAACERTEEPCGKTT